MAHHWKRSTNAGSNKSWSVLFYATRGQKPTCQLGETTSITEEEEEEAAVGNGKKERKKKKRAKHSPMWRHNSGTST